MTQQTHSRRTFLSHAATAAALGLSGTAMLSGVSAFATPKTQPLASTSSAGLIPYGSAVRAGALESDSAYREAIIANCQLPKAR
jgi:endo-1,4-beta-xylanase